MWTRAALRRWGTLGVAGFVDGQIVCAALLTQPERPQALVFTVLADGAAARSTMELVFRETIRIAHQERGRCRRIETALPLTMLPQRQLLGALRSVGFLPMGVRRHGVVWSYRASHLDEALQLGRTVLTAAQNRRSGLPGPHPARSQS